jgi:hypothetical protein
MALTTRQLEYVDRARRLAACETSADLHEFYAADPLHAGSATPETEAAAFGTAQFLLSRLLEIIDRRSS